MEGCGRGLGLMGPWLGENNWFGGRVQLQATISLRSGRNDERPDSYTISLKRFSMGKSFRLARFATSLSVLQLKFANGASRALKDGGVGLLARKLVLCGRVYCPFYAKDGKAYFVETNENYGRGPVPELGDDRRRSFDTYVCWHNSLDLNAKQASLLGFKKLCVNLLLNSCCSPCQSGRRALHWRYRLPDPA